MHASNQLWLHCFTEYIWLFLFKFNRVRNLFYEYNFPPHTATVTPKMTSRQAFKLQHIILHEMHYVYFSFLFPEHLVLQDLWKLYKTNSGTVLISLRSFTFSHRWMLIFRNNWTSTDYLSLYLNYLSISSVHQVLDLQSLSQSNCPQKHRWCSVIFLGLSDLVFYENILLTCDNVIQDGP